MGKVDIHIRIDSELVEEFDEKCRELGIQDRTNCIIEAMKGILGKSQVVDYLDKRIAQKMKQMTIYDIIKKALEKEAKDRAIDEAILDVVDRISSMVSNIEQVIMEFERMRSGLRGVDEVFEEARKLVDVINQSIPKLDSIQQELRKISKELELIRLGLFRSPRRGKKKKRKGEEEIMSWR